jgi:hypothetical protein
MSIIYFAEIDVVRDRRLVVEADGIGGAYASVIEGTFPVDYVTHLEKYFRTEDEATTAAIQMTEHRASPALVLSDLGLK